MSKHYFKRIFESIITRRKDSILIFSIIFILSFFIIVATCISRLGTNISNSVKDNIEISVYTNDVDFKNNEDCIDIDDDFTYYCRDNNCIYESSYATEAYTKDEYGTKSNGILASAVSYDAFADSNYEITNYFSDSNQVLVSTNTFVEEGDKIDIYIKDKPYTFEVVGFFINNDSSVSGKNPYYDENTKFIINKDDFFSIAKENNIKLKPNFMGIKTYGTTYEELELTFKDIIDKEAKSYTISSNIDEYNKVVKPSESLKDLYNVIMIVMVFISCLLLINVITFLNEKRIHEYAVLLAIGQSKLLSIISFALEILIIAFLAISLSFPLGIRVAKSSADKMLEANIKRQERMAMISGNQEDFDVFEKQLALYEEYEISISTLDVVYIYLINDTFILVSCLFAFISISRLKARELLIN